MSLHGDTHTYLQVAHRQPTKNTHAQLVNLHPLPLPLLPHASMSLVCGIAQASQVHPIEGPAAKLTFLAPLSWEVFTLAHAAYPQARFKPLRSWNHAIVQSYNRGV
jgi:hypothetical protein